MLQLKGFHQRAPDGDHWIAAIGKHSVTKVLQILWPGCCETMTVVKPVKYYRDQTAAKYLCWVLDSAAPYSQHSSRRHWCTRRHVKHVLKFRFDHHLLLRLQATKKKMINMPVKTKLCNTQVQPLNFWLHLQATDVQILDSSSYRKWLHCMLTPGVLEFHLWARIFTWKRQHRHSVRTGIFYAITMCQSPATCGAARHKAIHQIEMPRLHIQLRKLFHVVVGPAAGIHMSLPWQTVLQIWKARHSSSGSIWHRRLVFFSTQRH